MIENKVPTNQDIENYLKEYGWNYKTTESENGNVIISPFRLSSNDGVLISFRVEGEFIVVSTLDFMTELSDKDALTAFALNDTLKLIKVFPISKDPLCVDVGFELWAEACSKETFFAFMDMLCLGIETILDKREAKEIVFIPKFVRFQ